MNSTKLCQEVAVTVIQANCNVMSENAGMKSFTLT